jgi:3-oxoacyl-[acyl-carrier-protein] synthase II
VSVRSPQEQGKTAIYLKSGRCAQRATHATERDAIVNYRNPFCHFGTLRNDGRKDTMSASLLQLRRVVVTGVGIVSPLGRTSAETWSAVLRNESGMTSLEDALSKHQGLADDALERELEIARALPCQVVAPVKNFECDARTARFVQMALNAGTEAMEQSRLKDWLSTVKDGDKVVRQERIGVCMGNGMSSGREIAAGLHTLEEKGLRRLSPHFIPKILANSASGRLSLEFGLQGPNHSASTACAAGSHAIGDAMRCIQYGNADVMLAGGAEASIEPLGLAGFCRLRALSTGFSPEESSRPFDKARNGFVMGEGSAVLVLEELNHAMEREAPILAELAGYGLSGDAFHITAPDAEGRGAARAMKMALEQAGLDGSEIGYVNAHATSTPKGDEIEAGVIDKVLPPSSRDSNHELFVSSTKGATGHLLGAAGAIEAAITVMSLTNKVVPPTKNLTDIDGEHGFRHVLEPVPVEDLRAAISNSFGFGGTNACLVFKSIE